MSTESPVGYEESGTSYQHTKVDFCQNLDKADKLAAFRERFRLPENLIYLDGNSLGPLPKATPARIAEVGGITPALLAGSLSVQYLGCHIAETLLKCAASSLMGTVVPTDTSRPGCWKCFITALGGASCDDPELLQKQHSYDMCLDWNGSLQSCTVQLGS